MADSPVVNNTEIKIANAALSMLAAGAIGSWDEETELAARVNALFGDVLETCLAAHDWTFARLTRQLEQLATPPAAGWRYGFALPPDRIGLPSLITTSLRHREPLRDFMIALDAAGNQCLYADIAPLWARYRVRPAATLWPPAFRLFAAKALAAELAVPVTHDATLAAALRDEAWGPVQHDRRGGLFGKAMTADLQHPGFQGMYGTDPLTSAWHGG